VLTAATFIPIKYKLLEILSRSQFSSVIVIPDAKPKICVCIAALAALLHTSLLLITTEGAEAVGGALSVTTVDDTVFVSAAKVLNGHADIIKTVVAKIAKYFIFICSSLHEFLFMFHAQSSRCGGLILYLDIFCQKI
jgi:hypothetical protein